MTRDGGTRRTRAMASACDGISTEALEQNAIGQLVAAAEAQWPTNLGHIPDHLPDDFTFPCDVSAGDLRALRTALATIKGEKA